MLVILLGFPKIGGRDDLGDDRAAEAMRDRQLCDGSFRRRFLLRGIIKDHGAILGADVGALPVRRGRIVVGPEDFEELRVGDFCRIVFDQDGFGVAGLPSRVGSPPEVTKIVLVAA